MNTIKNFFNRVGVVMGADVRRGLLDGADFRGFKLLSNRPYLDTDADGNDFVNRNKPFRYPVAIRKLADVDVSKNVYGRRVIGNADDICLQAFDVYWSNMEAKANGVQNTLSEAILEAARSEGMEKCKYIVFDHPMHSRRGRGFAYVLENIAAPADSDDVAVITLVPKQLA